MARSSSFTADQFTATQFNTAEDKCKFANSMIRFIEKDFPRDKFTKSLYDGLHLHLFGHIAHYDISNFHAEWFSGVEAKLRWIRHVLQYISAGSPTHCWADVERVIRIWIEHNNILQRYLDRTAKSQRERVVYQTALSLARLDNALTMDKVTKYVRQMAVTVEQISDAIIDLSVLEDIARTISNLLLVHSKDFKLASISSNTNSFGLSNYIWMARDGDTWQMCAYRPMCKYLIGDEVSVPMIDGQLQWNRLAVAWELASQLPKAPPDVVAEVFSSGGSDAGELRSHEKGIPKTQGSPNSSTQKQGSEKAARSRRKGSAKV